MRLTAHMRFCFAWTALLCLAGTAFALPPQRATRTTITAASPNPSVVGQPVKVTFRVQPSVPGGSLTPTGDVWVMGLGQCKAPVEAGGCSLLIREPGTATLTAIYYGDRNFLPSTSTQAITLKVKDVSISTSPPLKVQSSPVAGSRGSGARNVRQDSFKQDFLAVFAEHPLGMTLALAVILIVFVGFGVSLLVAARAVFREITSPTPGPKTQSILALTVLKVSHWFDQ
jgi:hypothetical protein